MRFYLVVYNHATYGILIVALTTTPFAKHTTYPTEGTSMISNGYHLGLSIDNNNNNDHDNDNDDNREPTIERIKRYYCIYK